MKNQNNKPPEIKTINELEFDNLPLLARAFKNVTCAVRGHDANEVAFMGNAFHRIKECKRCRKIVA